MRSDAVGNPADENVGVLHRFELWPQKAQKAKKGDGLCVFGVSSTVNLEPLIGGFDERIFGQVAEEMICVFTDIANVSS